MFSSVRLILSLFIVLIFKLFIRFIRLFDDQLSVSKSSKFFVNTYGGPGIYSEEDSYFISEQEIKTLWKKWIKNI